MKNTIEQTTVNGFNTTALGVTVNPEITVV